MKKRQSKTHFDYKTFFGRDSFIYIGGPFVAYVSREKDNIKYVAFIKNSGLWISADIEGNDYIITEIPKIEEEKITLINQELLVKKGKHFYYINDYYQYYDEKFFNQYKILFRNVAPIFN